MKRNPPLFFQGFGELHPNTKTTLLYFQEKEDKNTWMIIIFQYHYVKSLKETIEREWENYMSNADENNLRVCLDTAYC